MKLEQLHNSPVARVLLVTLYSVLVGYFIGSSMRMDGFDPSIYGGYESIFRFSSANKQYWSQPQNIPIYVETNPRGAERLPPGIIEAHSDFISHGCIENETVATVSESRYLLALTVGIKQKDLVNKIVSKFPAENFTVIMFHYDGNTSDWDQFEWSHRVIHISALKQTKWWYSKRFLHPDIVYPYDYIFIWDEDLGVDHFNSLEYIKIVKKYGLEISQPGITSEKGITYEMTERMNNSEVHWRVRADMKDCVNSSTPPCAGFVEIMAPVFSRKSWNCVWNMIQNDLVHGWGLDFAFWRCVEKPAEKKIGVVDSQWIEHLSVPSLVDQGNTSQSNSFQGTTSQSDHSLQSNSTNGTIPLGVRQRSRLEWKEFEKRLNEQQS